MRTTTPFIAAVILIAAAALYPQKDQALVVATLPLLPEVHASSSASAPIDEPSPAAHAAAVPLRGTEEAKVPAATAPEKPLSPVRLSIPSIGLSKPIVQVGLNSVGEMDVPSGTTQNVGWYNGGPLPGEQGSAVIGAHVFAAFSALDRTKVGGELSITMNDGSVRRFVVESVTVHKLSEMSAEELFNRNDARRLNLITCAGTLTPDKSTYTHRLVVAAVAV